MSATEPFPRLPAHQYVMTKNSTEREDTKPRRRRISSNNLPAAPHGDTDVPALATSPQSAAAEAEAAKRHATEKLLRPHSKRRKARSLLRRWKTITMRHTWLNPLILLLTMLGIYAQNPTESNPLHSAIFLSYPVLQTTPGAPIEYGKGGRDFAFVAFYTVFFTFTREFIMQRVLRPLSIYLGVRTRGKQFRFMEQAYTCVYFGVFGPFGLYVMSRGPVWYFNTKGMFEGFPHRQHEGLFKAYYLLQAAYWIQQAAVLVLLLEKPRKDFKELVMHHILTIALIWCSYRFHFAFMGVAVYVTHDISDFFLASSKCLYYISHPLTDYYYATFIFIWIYLRHYLNLRILWATLTDFRTVGPFELNWETQQYKCWISQYITFALLAGLQMINLFWLYLILKIAKRAVVENKLEDERSENGEDDDEEEEEDEGERVERESTEEKRRRLGVGVNGNAKVGDSANHHMNGNGNGIVPAPKVLANGIPVTGLPPAMNGHARNTTTGVKTVQISAQQRKKKAK